FAAIKRTLAQSLSAAKALSNPTEKAAMRNSAGKLYASSKQANLLSAPKRRLKSSPSWKPRTKASARAARRCRSPVCWRKQGRKLQQNSANEIHRWLEPGTRTPIKKGQIWPYGQYQAPRDMRWIQERTTEKSD